MFQGTVLANPLPVALISLPGA